jgi:hypothetical protein
MHREQIRAAVVNSAHRYGDRNPQQFEQLERLVKRSDLAEAVHGLLSVFMVQSEARLRSAQQELAGKLLDVLPALAPADVPLNATLAAVLPNYDLSVEQLPRYLARVHGDRAVIERLAEVRRESLPPDHESAAKTMTWWLGPPGSES